MRQRYGIEFHDLSLLDEAFTHSSYVNEHKELGLKDNERLEFLGDAVLELTVSDYLYRKFPDKPEGIDPNPSSSSSNRGIFRFFKRSSF